MMFSIKICCLVTLTFVQFINLGQVQGHGYLVDPPSRALVNGYGDRMSMFCGGFRVQFNAENKGRCGECGDPYSQKRPRDNEVGGRLVRFRDRRVYEQGSAIQVKVKLTAAHKGSMEFRICDVGGPNNLVEQACLDRNVLKIAGTDQTLFRGDNKCIPNCISGDGVRQRAPFCCNGRNGYIMCKSVAQKKLKDLIGAQLYHVTLQLPKDFVANYTTLQWRYKTGNSWGTDENPKKSCVGCGNQEHFQNCADISVLPPGSPELQASSNASPTTSMPTTTTETWMSSEENENNGDVGLPDFDEYGEYPAPFKCECVRPFNSAFKVNCDKYCKYCDLMPFGLCPEGWYEDVAKPCSKVGCKITKSRNPRNF